LLFSTGSVILSVTRNIKIQKLILVIDRAMTIPSIQSYQGKYKTFVNHASEILL